MATGQRIHRLQLGSWSLAPVHGCINQTHLHAMHNTREIREGNPWRFQKSRRGSHPVRPVRLDALNRCLLPRQDVRTLDQRAKSYSAPVAPTKNQQLQCLPSHKNQLLQYQPAKITHPNGLQVWMWLPARCRSSDAFWLCGSCFETPPKRPNLILRAIYLGVLFNCN